MKAKESKQDNMTTNRKRSDSETALRDDVHCSHQCAGWQRPWRSCAVALPRSMC